MLLDLGEMPESHTGVNLATTFVTVLQNFGVDEKVRVSKSRKVSRGAHSPVMTIADPWHNR